MELRGLKAREFLEKKNIRLVSYSFLNINETDCRRLRVYHRSKYILVKYGESVLLYTFKSNRYLWFGNVGLFCYSGKDNFLHGIEKIEYEIRQKRVLRENKRKNLYLWYQTILLNTIVESPKPNKNTIRVFINNFYNKVAFYNFDKVVGVSPYNNRLDIEYIARTLKHTDIIEKSNIDNNYNVFISGVNCGKISKLIGTVI